MVTREQAYVILDVIECATETMSSWNKTRDGLCELGYTGREIEEATGALAKFASPSRDNPIIARDFQK